MISRKSSLALTFACLATLSLTVVAQAQRTPVPAQQRAAGMSAIELPRVVITGRVQRAETP